MLHPVQHQVEGEDGHAEDGSSTHCHLLLQLHPGGPQGQTCAGAERCWCRRQRSRGAGAEDGPGGRTGGPGDTGPGWDGPGRCVLPSPGAEPCRGHCGRAARPAAPVPLSTCPACPPPPPSSSSADPPPRVLLRLIQRRVFIARAGAAPAGGRGPGPPRARPARGRDGPGQARPRRPRRARQPGAYAPRPGAGRGGERAVPCCAGEGRAGGGEGRGRPPRDGSGGAAAPLLPWAAPRPVPGSSHRPPRARRLPRPGWAKPRPPPRPAPPGPGTGPRLRRPPAPLRRAARRGGTDPPGTPERPGPGRSHRSAGDWPGRDPHSPGAGPAVVPPPPPRSLGHTPGQTPGTLGGAVPVRPVPGAAQAHGPAGCHGVCAPPYPPRKRCCRARSFIRRDLWVPCPRGLQEPPARGWGGGTAASGRPAAPASPAGPA